MLTILFMPFLSHLLSCGIKIMYIKFKKCSGFWGLRPPDPLPGLRPRPPLGDLRPPDPLILAPPLSNPKYATDVTHLPTSKWCGSLSLRGRSVQGFELRTSYTRTRQYAWMNTDNLTGVHRASTNCAIAKDNPCSEGVIDVYKVCCIPVHANQRLLGL